MNSDQRLEVLRLTLALLSNRRFDGVSEVEYTYNKLITLLNQ